MNESIIHLCIPVTKKCYAATRSYGEICVRCNCCGRFDPSKAAILKARINYHLYELKHNREFDDWCDDKRLKNLQMLNVANNILTHTAIIKRLQSRLKKLNAKKPQPAPSQ